MLSRIVQHRFKRFNDKKLWKNENIEKTGDKKVLEMVSPRFFHRIVANFFKFRHAKVSPTSISMRALPIIF
ncbi:MAG: hypothetical protein SO532_04710, partial [Candidatus Borkfalkiaceae bacterium]|nr:hypothetical protein [Christensenellaceae bacterium]